MQNVFENVFENINTYERIFEKLYVKYQSSGDMLAPELELLMTLLLSGVGFHITQTILKNSVPNLGQAIQKKPDLVHSLMGALFDANRMTQQQQQVYPMTGQMNQGIPAPAPAPVQMSGPNIDVSSLLNGFMGQGQIPVPQNDVMDRPVPTRDVQDPPMGNIYKKQSSLKVDDDAMSMTSEISTGGPSVGYVKNKKGSKKNSTKIVSL